MTKTLRELYAIEKRDPLSIASWLKREGLRDQHIETAMREFGERLALGERFGYKDGISILSNKIRDRAYELSKDVAERIVEAIQPIEIPEPPPPPPEPEPEPEPPLPAWYVRAWNRVRETWQ